MSSGCDRVTVAWRVGTSPSGPCDEPPTQESHIVTAQLQGIKNEQCGSAHF